MAIPKTPHRFLFVASLGNPGSFHYTRHSAGHILLNAVAPLLSARISPSPSPKREPSPLYTTYKSETLMNKSGPSLTRHLLKWVHTTQHEIMRAMTMSTPPTWTLQELKNVDGFNPTLVILHDELEAPLGKIKVRRGGSEEASCRGHRGLISTMESLRKRNIYASDGNAAQRRTQEMAKKGSVPNDEVSLAISIMRIGVGIGRPETRERKDVADYVLTRMNETEITAVQRAAGFVAELLVEELYRPKGKS